MRDENIKHWMGSFYPYENDYDKEDAYNGKMPYLGMKNIEEIYIKLKGSKKGFSAFEKRAKAVADKTEGGAYIFKNEEKLFEVFKECLPFELQARKINCFGQLMQYDT